MTRLDASQTPQSRTNLAASRSSLARLADPLALLERLLDQVAGMPPVVS
jgi:hypothetical protein